MPFDYDLDYENLDLRKKPESVPRYKTPGFRIQ